MTTTMTRTGAAATGDLELLAAQDLHGTDVHTPVLVVGDPGLREALERFDAVGLGIPSSDWAMVIKSNSTEGAASFNPWSKGNRMVRVASAIETSPKGKFAGTVGALFGSSSTGASEGPVVGSLAATAIQVLRSQHVELLMKAVVSAGRRSVSYDLILRGPWDRSGAFEDAVTSGIDRPATTVRRLADFFGLPLGDILKATGISKSSFHSWDKPHQPRPRVSSQGDLWALAQLADDLSEAVEGPVREWMRADSRRRRLLTGGRFDELLLAAHRRADSKGVGRTAPPYAVTAAVGRQDGDPLSDIPDDYVPQRKSRQTRVAKAATRGPRQESD